MGEGRVVASRAAGLCSAVSAAKKNILLLFLCVLLFFFLRGSRRRPFLHKAGGHRVRRWRGVVARQWPSVRVRGLKKEHFHRPVSIGGPCTETIDHRSVKFRVP